MNDIEAKDWRKLCELVAKETDPQNLQRLLQQLTEALNARAKEAKEVDVQANPRKGL